MDTALLPVLACPAPDHGSLRLAAAGQKLACAVCGREYEIDDGIPVLLLDDSAAPAEQVRRG
jgi:uncharacterized protein YbaR (Trm112 family)